MATEAATSTATRDKPTKPHSRKQNKQEETKRHRSIFEVPPDFFDSCRLLPSPFSSLPDSDIFRDDALEESKSENEVIENNNTNTNDAKVMQRWSCNTCKAEFESLQDQRFHFKSDLHRFNIKLSVAGKTIIKEEDFDGATDSLCKDYDVSSISGSEDEDERETSLLAERQREFGGISKSKIFIELQNGERVSIWRNLLLNESENISFETDKSLVMDGAGVLYLTQREVIEKLKYILHEPRDNTRLRIVLLAKGGHFAGYVVRAKAGKKQSSKDAGGRTIHSAGASLRRYNELALKKDIQELLTLWKPHFAVASCIFIYAPSNNRQLFFDGEKPYFICQHRAIKSIPLTVRRPTLKEARRVYSLLVQISSEIRGEIALNAKEEPLSGAIITIDTKEENDTVGTSTPLHEAAMSGNAQQVLELLEQGLDPCIKDERGQTPYMLASEKEVRNTFRRFMASNLERWDWHAAKVPSALTKEMEESQAAKQEEAAQSQNGQKNSGSASQRGHGSAIISKEEELRRIQDEREKRAAAAERRIAAAIKAQGTGPSNLQLNNSSGSELLCSCCYVPLAGKTTIRIESDQNALLLKLCDRLSANIAALAGFLYALW
ncbi:hypothetical protein DH2020_046850 [Rehmannia glutinosa]|uniref:VLRF1 domain-containing protein n=1 Tax=Rehmannia glutinosa TaxID=99300 RepID=A0ABR0UA93_REHGL